MAVDRRLHSRTRHRAEPRRALTIGAVAGVAALVLPVELLEAGVASIGLSEAVPALAPPMAWGARLGTALLIALIGTSLGWAFGGLVPLFGRRKMTIAWPKSLRWDSLTRLARGIDGGASGDAGDRFVDARPFAVPSGSWSEWPDSTDWQPRRRLDMHPDAPPRPPIVASRDLPSLPEPRRPRRTGVDTQPPVVSVPVRTLISEAQERPMPRAPEPLSEAQLDSIRDLLARQDTGPAPDASEDADILDLSLADTIVTDDLPLSSLLDRFEQQVERKIAIDGAMSGGSRVEDTAPLPEAHTDLRAALETLKALSQPARKL